MRDAVVADDSDAAMIKKVWRMFWIGEAQTVDH